ncbi:hypothetical protein [Fervidibacter sacchari]
MLMQRLICVIGEVTVVTKRVKGRCSWQVAGLSERQVKWKVNEGSEKGKGRR